jgi:ribosome biogenesis GTPase / thiamine phosphate phosphatase
LSAAGNFGALDLGLVVASHGRHVVVETPEGRRLLCHPRGKKSECLVGDRVRWQATGDEGVIEAIDPRRNLLRRQDEWRSKAFAANIDRVLVVVAGEPVFSEGQLARALIAAADADVPAGVLLNKIDLASAAPARDRLRPYRAMGTPVLEAALKASPAQAQEVLAPWVSRGATLVLGASGMGKSTLINLLVPGATAQVGELSLALASGRHTTTTTQWYWLDESRRAALIDSPGFQEFGLQHLKPEQLASLMPDLAAHAGGCRFYNCSHRHEPGCAVREAAARGDISPQRLRLYEGFYDELSAPKW